MKLYDLLCGLMMRSGNDCAYLIASNVFDDYDKFIDARKLTNYDDINDDYCSQNNPLYYFANDDGTIRLFSNKINN